MDGNFFTPEKGKKYLNLNGLHYNCIGHDEEGRAWMQSDNKDKWTFVAVGCRQYKDGTMDWCHSLHGHFEK